MRFRSPSPDATRAAARVLAAGIDERGLVLALSGPLGAGKTVFVKGLAAGLGLDPGCVASPTFVIASEYGAGERGLRLAHVDLYRVESADELEAAGFLDLLVPGNVVAVEWADRLLEALPVERMEIRIVRAAGAGVPHAEGGREIEALARGAAAEASLLRWRAALARAEDVDLLNRARRESEAWD